MNRFFVGVAVLWLAGLSFPASSQMGMMGPHGMMGPPGMMGPRGMMGPGGMMGTSMVRRHFVMTNGIGQYASKENPLEPTEQTLQSGRRLYEQNCARCHGVSGIGDGPDGKALFPRPANVAAAAKMPMASDGYLFWTVSEGGVPVGSAMPPFKGSLGQDDIWRIITYLRVL